jgi:hypothetical protein
MGAGVSQSGSDETGGDSGLVSQERLSVFFDPDRQTFFPILWCFRMQFCSGLLAFSDSYEIEASIRVIE